MSDETGPHPSRGSINKSHLSLIIMSDLDGLIHAGPSRTQSPSGAAKVVKRTRQTREIISDWIVI
jgi:hypothetical protein